jgi:hypothetical protein
MSESPLLALRSQPGSICHSERSEESSKRNTVCREILRFAQNDKDCGGFDVSCHLNIYSTPIRDVIFFDERRRL